MSKNEVFGFELLYAIYSRDIHKKEEVIILFTHWFLIKNGFQCLGCGDSVSILFIYLFL